MLKTRARQHIRLYLGGETRRRKQQDVISEAECSGMRWLQLGNLRDTKQKLPS
jgi:hypothetical protein